MFYILSLKRSRPGDALWWGLDRRDYYSDLRYAYKCSQAEIDAEPHRLNNGVTTLAIPCAELDALAQLTVPADVVDALVKRAAKRGVGV